MRKMRKTRTNMASKTRTCDAESARVRIRPSSLIVYRDRTTNTSDQPSGYLSIPSKKPTTTRSEVGHGGIRVHLAVLAHGHDGAVGRAAHGPAQGGEALADLHNLALDDHLGAAGGRAQVGRVEGPADAEEGPEARAGDQREGDRGAEVEDGRCAAAVWREWWCLLDAVVVGARVGGFRGSGVEGFRGWVRGSGRETHGGCPGGCSAAAAR